MKGSEAITVMTNADPKFYRTLGPYLARRQVVTHVGGPIFDDDDKTWLVAADKGAVAGFIGVRPKGGLVVAESCWTAEGREALLPLLIDAAIRASEPSPLTATVRHEHASAYLAAGFAEVGSTRNFTRLARRAS